MKYPGATHEAIDFLNKILVFNPYFRINLKDALEHPVFKKVRKQKAEEVSGNPMQLSFEKMELDGATLRKLFLEEINMYHTKLI